jgi:ATP-dependent DNA ligase
MELKYDGFRLLVAKDDGRVVLRYRSGRDATSAFPDIAAAVAACPCGARSSTLSW